MKKLPCKFCELLTPEQVLQLSTPTYKIRKEKKLEHESLVDPSTVTVLSSVDQDKSVGASSSLTTSEDLPFKKDLQDLDEKWSLRMAMLEALITMGHPTFSPVKTPVSHAPPQVLYLNPLFYCQLFLLARPVRPPVRIELALLQLQLLKVWA